MTTVDTKANNAWLAAHRDEYVGEWIALHNGKLIDHTKHLTDLNIGDLPNRDVLFTMTRSKYGSAMEAMLMPEIERLRTENARLREALDIARKHLLNSDGFYFGPLNKTVIRSGTTQGGIERTQDGYPIGGITIHNYGQAVVQEMDAALAANETPTA